MQHKLVIYLDTPCKRSRSLAFHIQEKQMFAADIPVGPVYLAEHCNVADKITRNFDCTMQMYHYSSKWISQNGVVSGYTVSDALECHLPLN